jgi:alanyl-tRNA synthetase
VVGKKALQLITRVHTQRKHVAALLHTDADLIADAVQNLLDKFKTKEEYIKALEQKIVCAQVKELVAQKKSVNTITFLPALLTVSKDEAENYVRNIVFMSDMLKQALGSGFIFIALTSEQMVRFLCSVTDDLVARGISAKKFVFAHKERLCLTGGGRDTLVQGVVTAMSDDFSNILETCFSQFTQSCVS